MHRMPGLDLLRAVAILAVLCTHAWVAGGIGYGFGWLINYGWMGVDLFFALSGYLIGRQVLKGVARGERIDLADFYRRRAYRILPAYFAVLLLYLCISGFAEKPSMQPAWQFLTFTVNLLGEPGVPTAFSQVWSLCVEEHFYIVFPLVVFSMAPFATVRRVVGLMLAIVMAGFAWRVYAWHAWAAAPGLSGTATDIDPPHYMTLIYYPTYARLDGLLCGVAVALVSVYRPRFWQYIQNNANTIGLLGAVIVGVSVWVFDDIFSLTACAIGFPLVASGMALLVASATSGTSLLARFRVPGIEWLAGASYCVYLVHKAVFKFIFAQLPGWASHLGAPTFLFCVICAVAAAAVLHYGIERPFLRLRDARQTAMPQLLQER